MLANADDLVSLESAEGEILASLVIRPEFWPRMKTVESHWFSRGEDRLLFRSLKFAAEQNDGFADPVTAKNFIEAKFPEQSSSLINRLAGHVCRNYGAGPLADSLFEFHFRLLQTNGIRRTHLKWARAISLCCEERRSLAELRELVDDKPSFPSLEGVGE